jgi:phosphate transport system permease protein
MATATTTVPPAGPSVDLSGSRRRHFREKVVKRFFLAAGLSSILISVAIVASLIGESITFLRNIDLGSLWTDGWFPRRGLFDIKTLFVGSLLVTGVGMIIATPLGLGAAIYLAEYARPGVRRALKPIIELLAGIPSIVIGFFAFAWISPEIVKRIFPDASGFSLAAAGVGVGVLVTPLVASVAEDAMRAVPQSLREASYGMGARKSTTVLKVVFPAAISGIVAALILAISRAIGETMVVALAAGGSGGALFNTDVARPGQTITAAMASLASGTDQVAGGSGQGAGAAFNSLFFLGLLLFSVTFLLNLIGDLFVRRIRERY